MKTFILFSLILGLNFIAATSFADLDEPIGPNQLHSMAKQACEAEGLLFYNGTEECKKTEQNCWYNFKQCIRNSCPSYQDYYNDTYHNCTEDQVKDCQNLAQQEVEDEIWKACADAPESDNQGQFGRVIAQVLPQKDIVATPVDDGIIPELYEPDAPEVPEQDDSDPQGFGNEATLDSADYTAPGSAQQFSGSGCSIHTLAGNTGGLTNLLIALLAFLPLLGAAARRK